MSLFLQAEMKEARTRKIKERQFVIRFAKPMDVILQTTMMPGPC